MESTCEQDSNGKVLQPEYEPSLAENDNSCLGQVEVSNQDGDCVSTKTNRPREDVVADIHDSNQPEESAGSLNSTPLCEFQLTVKTEVVDENYCAPFEHNGQGDNGTDVLENVSESEVFGTLAETLSHVKTETESEEGDLQTSGVTNQSSSSSTPAYRCRYCGQQLKKFTTLQKHEDAHRDGSIYKCRYCEYYTLQRDRVKSHERTHTGEKPYSCDECDYRCTSMGDLAKHRFTHLKTLRHKCPICPFRCKMASGIRRHMHIHSEDRPFACNLCEGKFKRKSTLDNHMKIHSSLKAFQCDKCNYTCKTSNLLRLHMKTHSDVRNFPCPHPGCPQRCKTRSDLVKHQSVHMTSLDFKCVLCNKLYKSRQSLLLHIRRHEKKECPCEICGKVLHSKTNLMKHLAIHLSIKKFKCELCGHRFSSLSNLKHHMRVHDESRAFRCPICISSFQTANHLFTHIGSRHGKDFVYFCEICKRPFSRFIMLKTHIERNHSFGAGDAGCNEFVYNSECWVSDGEDLTKVHTFGENLQQDGRGGNFFAENISDLDSKPCSVQNTNRVVEAQIETIENSCHRLSSNSHLGNSSMGETAQDNSHSDNLGMGETTQSYSHSDNLGMGETAQDNSHSDNLGMGETAQDNSHSDNLGMGETAQDNSHSDNLGREETTQDNSHSDNSRREETTQDNTQRLSSHHSQSVDHDMMNINKVGREDDSGDLVKESVKDIYSNSNDEEANRENDSRKPVNVNGSVKATNSIDSETGVEHNSGQPVNVNGSVKATNSKDEEVGREDDSRELVNAKESVNINSNDNEAGRQDNSREPVVPNEPDSSCLPRNDFQHTPVSVSGEDLSSASSTDAAHAAIDTTGNPIPDLVLDSQDLGYEKLDINNENHSTDILETTIKSITNQEQVSTCLSQGCSQISNSNGNVSITNTDNLQITESGMVNGLTQSDCLDRKLMVKLERLPNGLHSQSTASEPEISNMEIKSKKIYRIGTYGCVRVFLVGKNSGVKFGLKRGKKSSFSNWFMNPDNMTQAAADRTRLYIQNQLKQCATQINPRGRKKRGRKKKSDSKLKLATSVVSHSETRNAAPKKSTSRPVKKNRKHSVKSKAGDKTSILQAPSLSILKAQVESVPNDMIEIDTSGSLCGLTDCYISLGERLYRNHNHLQNAQDLGELKYVPTIDINSQSQVASNQSERSRVKSASVSKSKSKINKCKILPVKSRKCPKGKSDLQEAKEVKKGSRKQNSTPKAEESVASLENVSGYVDASTSGSKDFPAVVEPCEIIQVKEVVDSPFKITWKKIGGSKRKRDQNSLCQKRKKDENINIAAVDGSVVSESNEDKDYAIKNTLEVTGLRDSNSNLQVDWFKHDNKQPHLGQKLEDVQGVNRRDHEAHSVPSLDEDGSRLVNGKLKGNDDAVKVMSLQEFEEEWQVKPRIVANIAVTDNHRSIPGVKSQDGRNRGRKRKKTWEAKQESGMKKAVVESSARTPSVPVPPDSQTCYYSGDEGGHIESSQNIYSHLSGSQEVTNSYRKVLKIMSSQCENGTRIHSVETVNKFTPALAVNKNKKSRGRPRKTNVQTKKKKSETECPLANTVDGVISHIGPSIGSNSTFYNKADSKHSSKSLENYIETCSGKKRKKKMEWEMSTKSSNIDCETFQTSKEENCRTLMAAEEGKKTGSLKLKLSLKSKSKDKKRKLKVAGLFGEILKKKNSIQDIQQKSSGQTKTKQPSKKTPAKNKNSQNLPIESSLAKQNQKANSQSQQKTLACAREHSEANSYSKPSKPNASVKKLKKQSLNEKGKKRKNSKNVPVSSDGSSEKRIKLPGLMSSDVCERRLTVECVTMLPKVLVGKMAVCASTKNQPKIYQDPFPSVENCYEASPPDRIVTTDTLSSDINSPQDSRVIVKTEPSIAGDISYNSYSYSSGSACEPLETMCSDLHTNLPIPLHTADGAVHVAGDISYSYSSGSACEPVENKCSDLPTNLPIFPLTDSAAGHEEESRQVGAKSTYESVSHCQPYPASLPILNKFSCAISATANGLITGQLKSEVTTANEESGPQENLPFVVELRDVNH